MNNKRGVSVMVGYVLLVVIAVGLSIGVYSYLKVFIPKERPECQNDVLLIIDKVDNCFITTDPGGNNIFSLDITLKNRGLFNVQAAYVRLAPEERKIREWINKDKANGGDNDLDFYFTEDRYGGLEPGKSKMWALTTGEVSLSTDNKYTIEVQPAEYTKEFGVVVCENAVITQNVECVSAS